MSIIETIKALCTIPGVSGDEAAVRAEIIARMEAHCDELRTDALGNVIAFKRGAKRPQEAILLCAHMDEVGLIVTHIEDDGLLRFAPVGGIDARVLPGKRVEIGEARLPGVIGAVAHHQLTEKEREAVPGADKLFINIGADSKEQAGQAVSVGERAVFAANFGELGGRCIMGRALDNRAGCALLLELLQNDLPYDCHFAFTVQEETGCTGAAVAANATRAGIAIVAETTTAADIPGSGGAQQICALGGGPVVSYADKRTVYDKALYDLAFETAGRLGISCQTKSAVVGGNDAGAIQQAGTGARVLGVSLPCRYLHSPLLVLHKDDIAATGKLLPALIEALGAESGASK